MEQLGRARVDAAARGDLLEQRERGEANEAVHVTAARWRFLLNVNGHGGGGGPGRRALELEGA